MPIPNGYITSKRDEMLEYARRMYGARVRIHEPTNVTDRVYKYMLSLNGLQLTLYFGTSTIAVVVRDRNGVIETHGSRRGGLPPTRVSSRSRQFSHRLVGLRDLEGNLVPPITVYHENWCVHAPAHEVEHVFRAEALFRLALELAA